ncbi:MAG: BON domain-containing protein [Ferruginibacter sp.]
MANRNQNSDYDREQPQGWFDPETYRQNLDRRNEQGQSNYGQTQNPNMSNRNEDINRTRMQTEYPNRNAFDRQYGDGNRKSNGNFNESQNTYNETPNNNAGKYGDSFDESYTSRGNTNNYRDSDRTRYSGFQNDNNNNNNRSDNNRNQRNNENRNNHDRDWWDRASDEVSSWFGDDDAERRRRMDKVNGPHSGKGPKGYTRTDERLKDDINDRLYHDSYIDASDVEITVENGEATLTGTVDSKNAKRRIEDIVEGITGIKDVENKLKVSQTVGNNFATGSRGNTESI